MRRWVFLAPAFICAGSHAQTLVKEEPVVPTEADDFQPEISPDKKRLPTSKKEIF
jgi:hypothetical protein